jgi:hypothetical protein
MRTFLALICLINIQVLISEIPLPSSYSGYINRQNLMFGPTAYYGTIASDMSYSIVDASGVLTLVSHKIKLDERVCLAVSEGHPLSTLPKISVHGTWYSKMDGSKKPSWFESELGKTAQGNVFPTSSDGGSTIMVLEHEELTVPMVDAVLYKDELQEYNVRITSFGDVLPTDGTTVVFDGSELMVLSYTYKVGYMEKVVMNNNAGSGVFLETHPFPHYVFAADKDTAAIIMLGRRSPKTDMTYEFTSVLVPYGYVMYIPEGTIHNDGFSVGSLATSMNVSEHRADTAFLRTASGNHVNITHVPISRVDRDDRGSFESVHLFW